jgi:hypothetical protein
MDLVSDTRQWNVPLAGTTYVKRLNLVLARKNKYLIKQLNEEE